MLQQHLRSLLLMNTTTNPSSSSSSSSHPAHHLHHQINDAQHPVVVDLDLIHPPHPIISMRQLLITSAELISQSDFPAAHRILSFLSSNSSPYGDSSERLVHQFTKALSLRIHNINIPINLPTTTTNINLLQMESCYLSLNQITPFIRFSHLTANQAILEATTSSNNNNNYIHILDFDIMHGVQWPPLMQALAERPNPPMLKITGTGHDLTLLQRTGHRLSKFAQSLGLTFHFHPLLLHNEDSITNIDELLPRDEDNNRHEEEVLAVNCVMYLHRLLKEDDNNCRQLRLFLHKIKSLNPVVVTVGETEANHNHPLFLQRFVEAVDHYTAIFESLEATVPPNSHERLAVEQIWFGKEIADIVAARGESRRERHERLETWELMLRSSGFCNVALSSYAVSQAKLLLKLHYPSEGYQLQVVNNCFFLGWRNRNLFSLSSWR